MKNILLHTLICLSTFACLQGQVTTQWVQQGAGPQSTYGNAITRDLAGDLYITGMFRDTVHFGTTTLTESSFGSPYYAKYDTSGNLLWAFKDRGGDGIISDGASGLYLWNDENANVQKILPDGSLIWNKELFTTSMFGSSGVMGIYPEGDRIYVTGFYSSDGYFGTDTLINQGGWDIFFAAFDSSGNPLWARTAGGTGLDKGYDAFPSSTGDVYFSGYFADSAWIDGVPVMSSGNKDIYLVKYSNDGTLKWVKTFGGTGFDLGAAMQEDEAGSLYLTGRFHTSMVMGSDTLSGSNLAAFVAKLDSAGNTQWAWSINGPGDDEEADIYYTDGTLYFISTTAGDVTLGSLSYTGLGGLDIAMGEIDSAGAPLWLKLYGSDFTDEGAGMLEYEGSLYFNGSFNSTGYFDSFSLVSEASWDIVTGKLSLSGTMSADPFVSDEKSLRVYPNPTEEALWFRNSSPLHNATLRCYSVAGQLMWEHMGVTGEEGSVDVQALPSGLYFLEVQQADEIARTTFVRF